MKGEDVVRTLNQLHLQRGVPKVLFCDNGSEFTSQAMDLWAYHNEVRIDFSRPGKPTDNAFIESFNGTLRSECLDVHWFGSLAEAKQLIERLSFPRVTLRNPIIAGPSRPASFHRQTTLAGR
jgi:putative transposase